MRKLLVGVMLVFVLLLTINGYVESAITETEIPPNIVLIYVDDQGWTGTSVQMDSDISESKSDFYKTPNLMSFAQQSMRFSNAYASSPVCSPSRISIQTGKSPVQIGMTNIIREPNYMKRINANPKILRKYQKEHMERKLAESASANGIDKNEITIAELIKSANPEYITGHFGKWHLGSGGPAHHGYDIHDGDTWNSDGQLSAPNPKDTFGITDRTLNFLHEREKDARPFFLQISYYAVHEKVIALEKTIMKYESSHTGSRHSNTEHAAMTEDLDEGFGRIIDAIYNHPSNERTYIFYMSDNGAYLHGITNNEPLSRGKGSLWEGGIRVPFLIGGPGISPGSVSDVPVIGWDVFPTIADLIGIDTPLPEGIEGGSLLGILLDPDGLGDINRPRGSQLVWHMPHYSDSHEVVPHSAIRIGDYKLIEVHESGHLYLYDLIADIGESSNLTQKKPNKTQEMKTKIDNYFNEIGSPSLKSNPDWCWWCFWE